MRYSAFRTASCPGEAALLCDWSNLREWEGRGTKTAQHDEALVDSICCNHLRCDKSWEVRPPRQSRVTVLSDVAELGVLRAEAVPYVSEKAGPVDDTVHVSSELAANDEALDIRAGLVAGIANLDTS
jgi:hypothetical protein